VTNPENQTKYPFKKHNFKQIKSIITKSFPVISFEKAVEILNQQTAKDEYLNVFNYGRVITSKGEAFICQHFGGDIPVWIKKYDRDTVPFYQKPDPTNPEKTLNADLIFPSINGGFGGEIVGSGQRQNSVTELKESLARQNIKNASVYDWYLNLRNDPSYQTTSGFGLGIERLIENLG
jgi:asparaginyl-tRNA synthetase